jgi:hypothetical protein
VDKGVAAMHWLSEDPDADFIWLRETTRPTKIYSGYCLQERIHCMWANDLSRARYYLPSVQEVLTLLTLLAETKGIKKVAFITRIERHLQNFYKLIYIEIMLKNNPKNKINTRT